MSDPAIHEYLRAVGIDPAATGPSDAELIARFSATRDEAAFELLVWRHAPLLQRVCRSVLNDRHAAEDATQATFLALARRAGTFAGRGSVVGWLYRVARRVSVRLAKQRARYPVAVAELDRVPAPDAPGAGADEAGRLCEEVDRLPERYRVPVLLCFFEGLTHAEAARRTGLPVGTIAGRLARAKALLARRLTRRGAALGAVALPVVSCAFVGSTAQAATAFAAGNAASLVSPIVLSLAHGVMQSMMTTILKATAASVALALGATAWALTPAAVPPAPPAPPMPPMPPAAAPVPKDMGKATDRTADAKQRIRSANNLKQIMIAVHNYHDANQFLPRDIADKNGKPLLSWRVLLLPYIEQDNLYKEFKLDEAWDSDTNKKALAKMPNVFKTGIEEKGATKTYYQGFAGKGTAFEPGRKLRIPNDFTDGSSNTIGVIEAGPPVEWTRPADIAYDPKKPFPKLDGPFKNVVMAAMMDGGALPFKPDLKPEVFRDLVERADGNVVDIDAAKADLKAFSKEDKELAAKLQKENVDLARKVTDLFIERQRLLAELAKKPQPGGPDLGKLVAEADELRHMLSALKRETEGLKKELGEK